jgi:hypothetical protein
MIGKLMKNMMFVWFGLSSAWVQAIPIGFNQAWFHNQYGLQYLDGYYDRSEVNRIFDLMELAGAKNIRLWFFESSDFPMLEWKNDHILKIKSSYIENVMDMLKIARSRGIRVYMTLLDGQSYRPDRLPMKELKKLKAIYRKDGGQEFLQNAVGPLLSAIDKEGLSNTISAIDISNEMDAVIKRFGFQGHWKGASKMLCHWREFIHRIPSFSVTPVTFSIRLHPLVVLPINLLDEQGPLACADVLDFHSYDDRGIILHCDSLRAYARQGKKKLILGEFGQDFFNVQYNDEMQTRLTKSFIHNAQNCGFDEALAWRLSDIRPGFNKEARYSYEAFGKMRPAFWEIHKNNHANDPENPNSGN